MSETSDELEIENLRSFSRSLGELLRQLGIYSIVQILAAIILAVISVGMLFSIVYETSLSEIFNIFQTSIWTILIAAIVLEVISYIFLIRLIILLRGAAKKEIPYEEKYRRSALLFLVGIIIGVILFILAIIIINWYLGIIWEIFNDPSFDIEDLEELPSTEFISTIIEIGRTAVSLGGFYYLKKNFEQLVFYMQGPNSLKITKGFQFLVIGYALLIVGSLLGFIIFLGGLLSFAGLIITIVGYFRASDGLKNTIWSHPDK